MFLFYRYKKVSNRGRTICSFITRSKERLDDYALNDSEEFPSVPVKWEQHYEVGGEYDGVRYKLSPFFIVVEIWTLHGFKLIRRTSNFTPQFLESNVYFSVNEDWESGSIRTSTCSLY
tara:strand:+ start:1027 stop:1380 length:354 start_codon:yes stop_codon:yes gene_type:complete